MDSFGKFILLVVIPFLVGFYGVRYYNTTHSDPQVLPDSIGVHKESQIETGRIKCIKQGAGYCEEYVILKVIKE